MPIDISCLEFIVSSIICNMNISNMTNIQAQSYLDKNTPEWRKCILPDATPMPTATPLPPEVETFKSSVINIGYTEYSRYVSRLKRTNNGYILYGMQSKSKDITLNDNQIYWWELCIDTSKSKWKFKTEVSYSFSDTYCYNISFNKSINIRNNVRGEYYKLDNDEIELNTLVKIRLPVDKNGILIYGSPYGIDTFDRYKLHQEEDILLKTYNLKYNEKILDRIFLKHEFKSITRQKELVYKSPRTPEYIKISMKYPIIYLNKDKYIDGAQDVANYDDHGYGDARVDVKNYTSK